MWVFLSDAFFSIVRQGRGINLLVRARKAGDIERHWPGARVTYTPGCDYHYRATVPQDDVRERIDACVASIDYGNFKNTVQEDDRHAAYARVWVAMKRFQHENRPLPKKGAR